MFNFLSLLTTTKPCCVIAAKLYQILAEIKLFSIKIMFLSFLPKLAAPKMSENSSLLKNIICTHLLI
jgi:hypothetical protein